MSEKYDHFGKAKDGTTICELTQFVARPFFTRTPCRGVSLKALHSASGTFQVIYPETCLNYTDARVGDKVKVKTRRVQLDADDPDFFISTMKVTEVDGAKVIGTYYDSMHDRKTFGDEWVERNRLSGDVLTWVWDTKGAKPVVGQLYHTALVSEISLIDRKADV